MVTPETPVTLRGYARHRGVSPKAVHSAINTGRLAKSVSRAADGKTYRIDVKAADREWLASTDLTKAPTSVVVRAEGQQPAPIADIDEQLEPGVVDPERMSLSDALAREKHWKSKTAELEYKRRIGQLVDAKEVEARMVDEYSRCRTKLLGLPRKAKAALPHLTHADVMAIDALVREALEDIAGPRPDQDAQP